jgi:signal transduction histidine kinase
MANIHTTSKSSLRQRRIDNSSFSSSVADKTNSLAVIKRKKLSLFHHNRQIESSYDHYHGCKSLLGHTPVFFVSLFIFLMICGASIAVVFTVAQSQKDAKEEEAIQLAMETGKYFSNQLDQAILPLFSMAQFALNLQMFHDLPDRIGKAGEPGALPFLPPEEGSERVSRNVTGVCDDPEMVTNFESIATAIKNQSKMDGILVNIQLAPAGVVCLLHPMNNTEDFEDGKYLDSSGAWGLDLLNDPYMKFTALGSIDDEDVVVAGPRPLVQCPDCGDFFIARLPIVDSRYEIIGLDGKSYPRWGFATALIDWTKMVERSGILHSFSEGHGGNGRNHDYFEFQLTRTDQKYINETDSYEETVVVLAESNGYAACREGRNHPQVSVALETTDSQWEMHVRYNASGITMWSAIVCTICILLSLCISWLVYTVLAQKQRHSTMQAQTLAQEAKVQTERNMTAYFAHELRNPLSAMDSALHTINEEEISEATRELVQGMKLCASFMSSIMNNLLDARKLQEGMMEIRSRPISISQMAKDVHKMTQPLVKQNVEFKLENAIPVEKDWVLGDTHRIQQVLTNMITNAIKYTRSGSITLRCSYGDDNQYCFEVIDTGPGIPKKEQERLFERFVQRGGAPGTGLGLAISKEIVIMMEGSIHFESDPTVEPGTNCIVTLPLETCSPVQDDSTSSSRRSQRTEPINEPISILIMDDVKMNRMMLQGRITKAIAPNAKIALAASGEEAMEIVKEQKFDVIICDQYMEESGGVMVGTDAIIAMRREGMDSFIIGCSGNDLEDEFLEAGADMVWGKPMPSNNEIIQQFRQGLKERDLV